MTKLYCPKGHEQLDRIFKGGAGINSIYHCYGCSRRYLDIDCLADLQNSQSDFRLSEIVDIQKKMSTESQKCEHNFEWQQLKFTGIGINPNMPVLTCSKCGQVRNNLPPFTTGTLLLVDVPSIKAELQEYGGDSYVDDINVVNIDSNSLVFERIKTGELENKCEHHFEVYFVDEVKNVSKSICKKCGKLLADKLRRLKND